MKGHIAFEAGEAAHLHRGGEVGCFVERRRRRGAELVADRLVPQIAHQRSEVALRLVRLELAEGDRARACRLVELVLAHVHFQGRPDILVGGVRRLHFAKADRVSTEAPEVPELHRAQVVLDVIVRSDDVVARETLARLGNDARYAPAHTGWPHGATRGSSSASSQTGQTREGGTSSTNTTRSRW